jgi:hypothetical protein
MKLLLFPLLLCTLSSHAQIHPSAQTANVTTHKTATQLRDLCREFMAMPGGSNIPPEQFLHVGECMGYVLGAVDGFHLAMVTWKVPTSVKACMPKGATIDELVQVTLKFIDGHPEDLSSAAADVVWRAMIATYPCPAKAPNP